VNKNIKNICRVGLVQREGPRKSKRWGRQERPQVNEMVQQAILRATQGQVFHQHKTCVRRETYKRGDRTGTAEDNKLKGPTGRGWPVADGNRNGKRPERVWGEKVIKRE